MGVKAIYPVTMPSKKVLSIATFKTNPSQNPNGDLPKDGKIQK